MLCTGDLLVHFIRMMRRIGSNTNFQLFLIIIIIIIITLTDIIEFYVIKRRNLAITPTLVIAIIVVTLVPLVINIWYCLHKFNLIQ